MSILEYQRRVVCAANLIQVKCESEYLSFLLIGARHWDTLMRDQYKLTTQNLPQPVIKYAETQGFIDQHGIFMTRKEAWEVAQDANQIIRRGGGDDEDGGTLYSENLY